VKAPLDSRWQSWPPSAKAPSTTDTARAIRLAGGQTRTSQAVWGSRPWRKRFNSARSAATPFIFQFPATNCRKSMSLRKDLAAGRAACPGSPPSLSSAAIFENPWESFNDSVDAPALQVLGRHFADGRLGAQLHGLGHRRRLYRPDLHGAGDSGFGRNLEPGIFPPLSQYAAQRAQFDA